MFKNIKQFFRNKMARLNFRRRQRGIILHPLLQNQAEAPNSEATFQDSPENNTFQRHGNFLSDIAEQIFAPRHGAEDHIDYQQIGESGSVLRESESWERENNSMRITRRKSMVVTCSGEVVEAEQVRCKCGECGGYDVQLFRCSRCGQPLCHLHALILIQPTGPIILCRKHFKDAVNSWNTWNAIDQAQGNIPSATIYPGNPYSVNALRNFCGGPES